VVLICENKQKEMDLEEFWETLQKIIAPGEEITWHRLWREFGRKGTGYFTSSLSEKGFIMIGYRGVIKINEDRRGEKIV